MPSSLAQETMMDDSRRKAGYRRTKSGGDEGARVGSPLQKDRFVYSSHSEFHLRRSQ